MTTPSVVVSRLLLFCISLFLSTALVSAADNMSVSGVTTCQAISDAPRHAFPEIARGCAEKLSYVGAYFADGKFRTGSVSSAQAQERASFERHGAPADRPPDVPAIVNLHPREQFVENLDRNHVKQKTASGRSRWADWRDDLVTFAYGHELALLAPEDVTTDTAGRVIVVDAGAQTIHVLGRKESFRILAGPGYRLQHVGAVATDADCNIYVADPVLGIVVEFDRDGRYIRDIGRVGDSEGVFYHPAALAVDSRFQLYVADEGREMILVLDRDGRVVKRAGGRRHDLGVTLQHPVAMAVQSDEVVVLDSGGKRIQIFDSEFRLRSAFDTGLTQARASVDLDSANNIYLTSNGSQRIRVFDHYGRRKGEFGRTGSGRGEIATARSVWIDANDKMYVADKDNRRIEVFQIQRTDTRLHAGTH